MPAVTLATYALRHRRERSDEYLQLVSFDGTVSFADSFKLFADDLKSTHSVDDARQSLQQTLQVHRKQGLVWGLLKAGDYGYAADLVNVDTLREAYKRRPQDAELIPFYFALKADTAAKTAILIVQRYGAKGVFTEFINAFHSFFRQRHPEFTFDVKRLIPAEVIRHLLNGRLKSIELKTYEIPSDIATKVRAFGNLRDTGAVTIRVDAKRNSVLARPGWLDKIIDKKIKLVEVTESLGWDQDRIRIGVEWEGKKRMVDFHRPESIAPYIDTAKDVKIGDDGHPVFDSIHAYAMKLLAELEQEVGTT